MTPPVPSVTNAPDVEQVKRIACNTVCRWCADERPIEEHGSTWRHRFSIQGAVMGECAATKIRRAWREAGYE